MFWVPHLVCGLWGVWFLVWAFVCIGVGYGFFRFVRLVDDASCGLFLLFGSSCLFHLSVTLSPYFIILIVFPIITIIIIIIEANLKSKITAFITFMGIIALASFTNGTMNLPKEVKEALNIKEIKGKKVFIQDENGKIYIEKA